VPVQHAVLALLADGDSHGYELRAEFERAVGPQWGQLNIGHLYQVLDRLVRDELVTRREVEQERLPDRVVYQLTDEGREELASWLETPFVRQSGYRDDFFLKLVAAARLGRKALEDVLSVQRSAYLAELSTLSELRKEHRQEPVVVLLIDAARRHTEANLHTVEQAETSLDTLTASATQARRTANQAQTVAREKKAAG
jgi:DNA-binding PadR family transcriptional regulator